MGITWDPSCNACDLDLYARAQPDAEVLYYGHTRTAQGDTFFKDFLSSPALSHGQETIAFSVPVDLSILRLAVNFFGGSASAGGVRGEIRLAVNERTYAMPFHITATQGNQGAGMQAVMAGAAPTGPHTVLIDPLSIVGGKAAHS
ncbi:hypothetical protein RM530_17660 [Algiphilus sp. W345]|uniref:Uncharacterized protein n=1 Tax=Banduia mediterranea TaxID=3075609 RepID=A0ABU2WMR4_9GAMM|nr:hypothetical protein [Algiphilus sp. W345]MDT0499173.1 hypothetical protein [Algiphilus sp. W345]